MNTDVIIVGQGMAGLVLSILLKRRGVDSIILNRVDNRSAIPLPKTIPPSTLKLLHSLNLLEIFAEVSSKNFGYQSVWGTNKLTHDQFFHHNPFKYGLKIHKSKLVDRLCNIVKESLVDYNSLSAVQINDNNVEVEISACKEKQKLVGKIIIDATGRNRALTKYLDVSSERYDDLVALSCHLPFKRHPSIKQQVFLESFPAGWGVVSPFDESKNVMSLYTYKSSPYFSEMKNYSSWSNLLSTTNFLKEFLAVDADTKVKGREAETSKLSRLSGKNWLAVGDAAMAFDPLSSHGISNAVYCSKVAAEAIDLYLNRDDNKALMMYEHKLEEIFKEFMRHKQNLYLSEQRWSSSYFWKTAHSVESLKATTISI